MENKKYTKILEGNIQLGRYPIEKLKRVDKPTTRITDDVRRFDERQTGFNKAYRGDFGPLGGRNSMPGRDLVGQAIASMLSSFPPVDLTGPAIPGIPSMSGISRETGIPPMPDGTMPPLSQMPAMIRQRLSEITGKDVSNMTPQELMAAISAAIKVTEEKTPLPDDPVITSRHIKCFGYFLGADIMGICELPQYAVYSHDNEGNIIECRHKYAISLVVDQGFRTFKASSGDDWISFSQSMKGYTHSAFIAYQLTNYIRNLGYPARVHHALNYQVVVPPLLLLSGIGEMSRVGIVLNPFLGLRFKAAVVTTDLPLLPDKPVDFGLQDFCDKCKKCARECPSRAISDGTRIMHNGYETWDFNVERCTKFRMGNPHGAMCGRCIKVCPWNKPEGWTHDTARWTIKHTPFMNDFFIKMDDFLGYSKPRKEYQWWFNPI